MTQTKEDIFPPRLLSKLCWSQAPLKVNGKSYSGTQVGCELIRSQGPNSGLLTLLSMTFPPLFTN